MEIENPLSFRGWKRRNNLSPTNTIPSVEVLNLTPTQIFSPHQIPEAKPAKNRKKLKSLRHFLSTNFPNNIVTLYSKSPAEMTEAREAQPRREP